MVVEDRGRERQSSRSFMNLIDFDIATAGMIRSSGSARSTPEASKVHLRRSRSVTVNAGRYA